MEKSLFRLLAIHIYEDCDDAIVKILKKGKTYFFCGGYRFVNGWIEHDGTSTLDKDFFSSDLKINLNFSVIVGKNGDGKSSLIDMVIRTINNFSCHAGYSRSRVRAKGVHTKLFYEVDGQIYAIETSDECAVKYAGAVKQYECRNALLIDPEAQNFFENKDPFPFSTLVENYSLHAFNALDYHEESLGVKNWLESILNSSSRYPSIITILPYRESGTINALQETYLTQNKLINFFTNVWKTDIPGTDIKADGVEFAVFGEPIYEGLKLRQHRFTTLPRYDQDRVSDFWEKVLSAYDAYPEFYESALSEFAENKTIGDSSLVSASERMFQSVAPKIDKRVKRFYPLTLDQLEFLQDLVDVYEIWKDSPLIRDSEGLALKGITSSYYDNWRQKAMLALVHETYEVYERFRKLSGNGANIVKFMTILIDDVIADQTLMSRQIRQTLNFINHYELFRPYEQVNNSGERKGYITFTELSEICSKAKEEDKNDYLMDYLLPPMFSLKIMMDKGGKRFPLAKLSSGLRQLLSLVSNLIDYLQRVDNMPTNRPGWVPYSYVNIILDEIDLYFHPEFQRQTINYIINVLGKIPYRSIQSINFIISTHSPFVLSDIPRQNVLFLKEGKQDYSMQENTFGANIHTLLKNGFFLEGMPIGDFAKEKINTLFSQLNSSQRIDDEDLDKIESLALLVSEPLLRKQLLSLIASRRSLGFNDEIEKLKKRIAELEGRINA